MFNVYSVRNRQIYNSQVNFKAFMGTSTIEGKRYRHETRFLRNYPTLDFVKRYLSEVFSQGTHIAEFGCSQGQKPYSLAALLADENRDKRYTITGYDMAPEVIQHAKKGEFELSRDCNEQIFLDDNRNAKHLTRFSITGVSAQETTDIRRKFYEYFSKSNADGTTLRVKPEKVAGIVDFSLGDIREIDEIYSSPQKRKPGVVIFQNALYHLLENKAKPSKYGYTPELESVKKLFGKIHGLLPENGLFVMGTLSSEHMFNEYEPETNSESRLLYQGSYRMRVFDSSPVHEALREVGFEPAFYEIATNDMIGYLPSVWKKVAKK